jgi:signal transduction histidine kinase
VRRRAVPFLIVAPLVVVLLGLAVAAAVAALGVLGLRSQREEAAELRSQLLAVTCAARLDAIAQEHHGAFVQRSAQRAGAEFLVLETATGAVLESSLPSVAPELTAELLTERSGAIETELGRTHYTTAAFRDGERLAVALVGAPEVPFASSSLATSVGTFAALLIAAAAFVAWALARDVHGDVMFVRTRIVAMAKEERAPEGEPIPVRTLDQVGQLTASFNVLLERFKAAERAYRQDLLGATAFDRDRSEFLAALSHELRTPLNAILGFTDVLLAEVDGPLSEEARENLTIVRTSGEHLRSLIDDILALSAIESGELRLSREVADVAGIARDVVAEARVTAEQKGLPILLELPEQKALALVDARRVRQILGNVLGNAVKFTSEGYVRLTVTQDEQNVHVVVSDTGPGIPAEALERIFHEYQQSGGPTAQRTGTGLGLAITRRLVQMHGGAVRVESTLGQGARFTITLPIHPGGARASVPPHLWTRGEPLIRDGS